MKLICDKITYTYCVTNEFDRLLRFKTWETRLFKMPCLKMPHLVTGTRTAVASELSQWDFTYQLAVTNSDIHTLTSLINVALRLLILSFFIQGYSLIREATFINFHIFFQGLLHKYLNNVFSEIYAISLIFLHWKITLDLNFAQLFRFRMPRQLPWI